MRQVHAIPPPTDRPARGCPVLLLPMNLLCLAMVPLALLPGMLRAASAPSPATTAPPPPAASSQSGGFVFSLLPKSLQKNPRLDFNIFTEMTPEGRAVAAPTQEKPAYYVAQAGGVYQGGIGSEGAFKSPPLEKLEQMMQKSLAEGGYLPGEPAGRPPTVAIVYHWGAHSFHPPEDVREENGVGSPPLPEVVVRKALLDRALLLGGAKFAREVVRAMEQVDRKATLQRSFVPPDGGDFMGSVGDMMPDPFEQLRARSPEMERLVVELFSSSFFVIASAYNYDALAKGQRRLLWRTKLTVNSLGVNMLETIPLLIATGGPYFGRETVDPVVIAKRVSRSGKVEVGTPTVVPDKPAPANAPGP